MGKALGVEPSAAVFGGGLVWGPSGAAEAGLARVGGKFREAAPRFLVGPFLCSGAKLTVRGSGC
jgi:hypothetical protein